MRRPRPRPKERRGVAVPAELRDAMREVREVIRMARRDRMPLDFGDAVQVAAVSGGRTGGPSRPYVLDYRPTDDPERGRWSLTLHPIEINDIADGRMTEIVMHCCAAPECRRKFRETDELCGDCDYVPDPVYARLTFKEAGPRLEGMKIAGLPPAATRDDLLAALGPPSESGGGSRDPTLGYIRPWITYHLPDCHIHFEFGRRGDVQTVTFLPVDRRSIGASPQPGPSDEAHRGA